MEMPNWRKNNFQLREMPHSVLKDFNNKSITINFNNFVFHDISNQNFSFDECLLNYLQLKCNINYLLSSKNTIWLSERVEDSVSHPILQIIYGIQFLNFFFTRYSRQNIIVQYTKNNDIHLYQRYKGIYDLLHSYCVLLNDYNYVKGMNLKILKQLEKVTKNNIERINDSKPCESCTAFREKLMTLEEKYHDMMKTCSSMKAEKEKIIMRYATGEKHLLEAQKLSKSFEKKSENFLKDNAVLQKKLNKAQENITKLNSEINSKFSEITQLRHQLERKKDDVNSKDMQLKWTQNRLKIVSDAQKETQRKFNEVVVKVSELTKECDGLKLQLFNCAKEMQKPKIDSVIVPSDEPDIKRRCVSLQNSPSKISCILNSNENLLNSSPMEQKSAGHDVTSLLAEINSVQQEYSTFKKESAVANLLLLQEKEKVLSLQKQITKMEILEKLIQSKELSLHTMESNLTRLDIERKELLSDIEVYREREIQMVDFTQKLIDKNVQLQVELTDLQSEVMQLNEKQKPLLENISELSKELLCLKQQLAIEMSSREYECGILTKYIAEKVYENEKLQQKVNDLEGDISIMHKKYGSAVRAMNRELHLYHVKLKNNSQFINSSMKKTDPINEKHRSSEETENFFINKGELFEKIVKLQEINVRRAEKLDFLEEHSNALLEELQKKRTTEKS